MGQLEGLQCRCGLCGVGNCIVEVARALAANTLMAPGGMHPQLQLVAAAYDTARKMGKGSDGAAGGFAV